MDFDSNRTPQRKKARQVFNRAGVSISSESERGSAHQTRSKSLPGSFLHARSKSAICASSAPRSFIASLAISPISCASVSMCYWCSLAVARLSKSALSSLSSNESSAISKAFSRLGFIVMAHASISFEALILHCSSKGGYCGASDPVRPIVR